MIRLKNIKIKFCALVLAVITAVSFNAPTLKMVLSENQINYNVEKIEYADENESFFMSDGFFAGKSTEYNPHLATLSMFMAKYSMNKGSPTDEPDVEQWYKNQPKRLNTFFDLINFTDFETNDDYKARTAYNTIGIAAARKVIGDSTVVAVTVRSGGYFFEWGGNVWLGDGKDTDYMHKGWYDAAMKVIAFMKNYIQKHSINGKVKLWMSGYSRGGAVINLAGGLFDNDIKNGNLSKRLGSISVAHDDMFVYTFETPQGANLNSTTVEKPRSDLYNNIFNIINPNDLVPKVAMTEWGFTRFGIDKFITTKFFDTDNFAKNREVMKLFYVNYEDKDYGYHADDYIQLYVVPVEEVIEAFHGIGGFIGTVAGEEIAGAIYDKIPFLEKDETKKNYDMNVILTRILEEGAKEVGTRDDYVAKYQTTAMTLMHRLVGDIKSENASVGDIVWMGILELFRNSDRSPSNDSMLGSGDIDYLQCLRAFIDLLFEVPSEIFGLMFSFAAVFQNHETNLTLSHMMAQDSLFIDDYNETKGTSYNVVPLLDNGSFRRITFDSINDVTIHGYKGGEKYTALRAEGHFFGSSDIDTIVDTVACGYYSYVFGERIEVFLPANGTYDIYGKSYSKKPGHSISMKGYIYKSNSKNYDNYIRETIIDKSATSYWWNMKVLSDTAK